MSLTVLASKRRVGLPSRLYVRTTAPTHVGMCRTGASHGRCFGNGEERVRGAKVDGLVSESLDTAARADALVVDACAGRAVVDVKHLRVQGEWERRSSTGHLSRDLDVDDWQHDRDGLGPLGGRICDPCDLGVKLLSDEPDGKEGPALPDDGSCIEGHRLTINGRRSGSERESNGFERGGAVRQAKADLRDTTVRLRCV